MSKVFDFFSRTVLEPEHENVDAMVEENGLYVGKIPDAHEVARIRNMADNLQRFRQQIETMVQQYDEQWELYVLTVAMNLKDMTMRRKGNPNILTEQFDELEPYIDENGNVWLVKPKS